jgi:CheY-like chemotaxis protein
MSRSQHANGARDARMPRILLVEDNELARFALSRSLTHAGYEVIEAEDGCQALEAQRREPVDLVITDIVLPVKDGLETIMELKQSSPATPVIAYTGHPRHNTIDYLATARAVGAARVFAKPFDHVELIDAVAELIVTVKPAAAANDGS